MTAFLLFSSLWSALSQDPLVGRKLPPYTMLVNYGAERGKLHCYVCEHGDKEGMILFGKSTAGMESLVPMIADAARQRSAFKAWVTLLSKDDRKDREILAWGEQQPGLIAVGRFEDEAGPPSYGFGLGNELQLVYFREGKVIEVLRSEKGKNLNPDQVKQLLKKYEPVKVK